MNKRLGTALAALALSALAVTGCSAPAANGPAAASAPSSTPAAAASAAPAELAASGSPAGDIVVNRAGMSVYIFDKDVKGSGKSACAGECAALWPAVTASGGEPVVDGVDGEVGVIQGGAANGQLTLDGMPLYLFAKDTAPGDVAGQGVKGVWWLVDPSGEKISKAAG